MSDTHQQTIGEQLDKQIDLLKERLETLEVSNESVSGLTTRINEIESAIEELDANAGTGSGGSADKETLREVVLEEFGDDIRAAAGRIMLPARKIGPSPAGVYHTVDRWGIHFSTGRTAHLGSAVVETDEAGTFTAALYEYDGSDTIGEVAVREIDVEQGVNEIDLDMEIPEAGEYLLTRVGDHSLRRREWGGWNSQSREGIVLHGGAKPDSVDTEYAPYDANRYWYYFFNLDIASSEDAH